MFEHLKDLKAKCWGSPNMPPRPFWLKQGITLNKPDGLFAFGVKTPSNGTKNILMCIQAYFLKHLFFESNKPKGKERYGQLRTNHLLYWNPNCYGFLMMFNSLNFRHCLKTGHFFSEMSEIWRLLSKSVDWISDTFCVWNLTQHKNQIYDKFGFQTFTVYYLDECLSQDQSNMISVFHIEEIL